MRLSVEGRFSRITGLCFGASRCTFRSLLTILILAIVGAQPVVAGTGSGIGQPILVTQIPAGLDLERAPSVSGGMLRADYGVGGRILVVPPDSSPRVLTEGFKSACDPDVSFDGKRILFAAKREADDPWNIFEMQCDGPNARQITNNLGNCRSPGYQSVIYTIDSTEPWYQITFVSDAAGTINECSPARATHLYSCRLDGSSVRRLTHNLSSDFDPFIMFDGRLVYASWQRHSSSAGAWGCVGLLGINLDGTDLALYAGGRSRRIRHMPCATTDGLLVFVEADAVPWDGSGQLAGVTIRRPLLSYRPITQSPESLFHSPSPLPDGAILVSRRSAGGTDTHGVYRLDPESGKIEPVFDDPKYHDIQARLVAPRREPDGRSSVVTERDPHGKFYCLNAYISDLEKPEWTPPGTVRKIRVLEGVSLRAENADRHFRPESALPTVNGLPSRVQRRVLGEIPVEEDGSFNIEVPANAPVEIQILDADGLALRSCGWIWARNHEPRGCIGCHEDGELTPENFFMDALASPTTVICPPPDERRTVDFRRDVMPIVAAKCIPCHQLGKTEPYLGTGPDRIRDRGDKPDYYLAYNDLVGPPGKYVEPGKARTSPLIWHILGRNTARPWDAGASARPVRQIPPGESEPLTQEEKRTFIEWIDFGALWDGIPGSERTSAGQGNF